jgi:hypothetical protein
VAPIIPTSQASPTELITGTATLVPLPEITLQFPTAIAQAEPVNPQAQPVQGNSAKENNRPAWLTLQRAIFLGIILLIWIILGGWFYFSYRRSQ